MWRRAVSAGWWLDALAGRDAEPASQPMSLDRSAYSSNSKMDDWRRGGRSRSATEGSGFRSRRVRYRTRRLTN